MKAILASTTELRLNLKYYLDLAGNEDQVVAIEKGSRRYKNTARENVVVMITMKEFEALRAAAGQKGKGLLTAKLVNAPPPPPPDITFVTSGNR